MGTPKHPEPSGAKDEDVRQGRTGRPVKEAARLKSKRLYVHWTPDEAQVFETAYQRQNLIKPLSRNDYAIERILRPDSTGRSVGAKSVAGDIKNLLNAVVSLLNLLNILNKEIKAIGINYNQSVKRLNGLYLPKEVRAEINVQTSTWQQIKDQLPDFDAINKGLNEFLENVSNSSK